MQHPGHDEIEVSVFGRGIGESAAIHVGNGRWIVIDSFKNGENLPVAEAYLSSIGVSARAVEAILLTHWHDDHISGAADLVKAAPNAIVALPITLENDEFLAFLEKSHPSEGQFSSGVNELRDIMGLLLERGCSPRWSFAEKRIAGGPAQLFELEALSPSDEQVTQFLRSLPDWLEQHAVGGRLVRPDRNDTSVASVVRIGSKKLLFGADLETRTRASGWQHVHSNSWKERGEAQFFKIPHHGSETGHYEPVWRDMLEANVCAVLTPWNKSSTLPTEADVARILSFTNRAFAASKPVARETLKRMALVEGIIRQKGIKLSLGSEDVGQARFRRSISGQDDWQVEFFGTGATHLADIAA